MSTVKEDVKKIINKLPEDVTIEDIQYHLYVLQKIRKGINDSETGKVLNHSQVKEKLSKWI